MNISELTDMLVISSQQYNQAKFNPWWNGNHEEAIYRYSTFSKEALQNARDCLAECGKDALLSPVGDMGLNLFHLSVWHNFHDIVKELLCDGRINREDINRPDGKGHGLTPFLLACACGNEAMAKLLLEHGADGCACDERGMNAYHFLTYPRIQGLALAGSCLEWSAEQRGEIARLLDCDINQKDRNGLTPLERMLSTDHCSEYTWGLADIFLEKGASTDYVDEDGRTLLMMALRNGHKTAALTLAQRCPKLLNIADNQGRTPAGHAVYFHDQAMYIALTDHGAVSDGTGDMEMFPMSQVTSNAFAHVHRNNKDGQRLAMYLARKMARQADPDDDDEMGDLTGILHNALMGDDEAGVLDIFEDSDIFTMPIHYHGQRICLRDECLVLGYGTGVLRKLAKRGVDMDKAVVKGRTPACILASQKSYHPLQNEVYFEEAAGLFSRESMEYLDNNGEAAVHLAARQGHTGMLKAMIEKGVDVNLEKDAPARAGMTPLHEACAAGHRDVVKMLIDAGADDAVKDSEGETPAHLALQEKRFGEQPNMEQRAGVLRELKHLDIPRNDGKTPLMLLKYLHRELLPIFLDRGVDVNHRDNLGRTALMLNPCKDMVKELLRAGADITLADSEGNTALHHALIEYSEDTARYLIKKGADYSCPNNDGETPADLAVKRGFESVLDVMV